MERHTPLHAAGRDAGGFDAALWESRMAGCVTGPERLNTINTVNTVAPMKQTVQVTRLQRACRLLRARLNRLEDPREPLSARERRLLGHQTSRLARVVETLVFQSKEGERHAA